MEAIQAPEGGFGMSDQSTHLWRECWQPCMPGATCFGVSKLLQVRRGRITATEDEYGSNFHSTLSCEAPISGRRPSA